MSSALLQLMATRGAAAAALPTPTIWYDASDTGTITNVSGKASAIADKGTSGDDLIQPTDVNRPLTGSTTRNGLNTLDYSAGSKSLYNLAPSATQITVQFLVGYHGSTISNTTTGLCLVSYNAANIGWESVFLGSVSGSFANELVSHFANPSASPKKNAYTTAVAIIASGISIVVVRSTASACELRLNGGADLRNANTGGFSFNTVADIFLNCGSSTGSNKGWDEFCELRAYANDLTDDEINAVGSALASKWGITWTNIS